MPSTPAGLRSFSPTWSPALRLLVSIAVQHAAYTLVHSIASSRPSSDQSVPSSPTTEWSEYGAKFLNATCQHLGVLPESLPPDEGESVVQIRAAAQGDEEHEREGLLEKEKDRGFEVINELLLVALGMGERRAEDGKTVLWEQDDLFGEVEVDVQKNGAMRGAGGKASEGEDQGLKDELQLVPESAREDEPLTEDSNVKLKYKTREEAKKEKEKAQQGIAPPERPNDPCHYDARARAILFGACQALGIEMQQIWQAEKAVAQTLYFFLSERKAAARSTGSDAKDEIHLPAASSTSQGTLLSSEERDGGRRAWMNFSGAQAVKTRNQAGKWAKWAATGTGFILGGVAVGLTGGLAAPVVAPLLAGLTGASFLATSGGIVLMGTLFGLGGGGLAGYKTRRRLQGIDEFEFEVIKTEDLEGIVEIPSLHATIVASGLLLEQDQYIVPWREALGRTIDRRDVYAIKSETASMLLTGRNLRSYVIDFAIRSGGQKAAEGIIKQTALAGLGALTLPITIFSAASFSLDSVFIRAKDKARKAGVILAETLSKEVQGHRPVILIGTSLGCTTIVTALLELAKNPELHTHIVDSVLLISGPLSMAPSQWRLARTVVARRFVNAYSSKDMVCRLAAHLGSGLKWEEMREGELPKVAGAEPVSSKPVPGIENVDVSDLLCGHFEVCEGEKLRAVLKRVKFDE